MNQLMSEYGLNKCSFYVVDSVNSHVTYGVHVAVIGVDYPASGKGVIVPLAMQMSLHVIVRMPARGGFWSTRSPLMGRNIGWGSLLSRSGFTSWCLVSQRGSMAGCVSGDPGVSGVVGVVTCTGRGCGGALGVGSVCCA